MRLGLALCLLVILTIGIHMTLGRMEIESPFIGEYERSPLRTLTLTSYREVEDLGAPLQRWAEGSGYKFRVGSPFGQKGSVIFEIWNGLIVILGDDRMDDPGLIHYIYLNSDTVDDPALDQAAEQLRLMLVPFGQVEVTSAPPGTRPREESTNRFRRR